MASRRAGRRRGRGTRRDAERALALLQAEVIEGHLTVAGTFAALLDSWWTTMAAHRWEDATALRHRQDIVAYLEPALGRRRVSDLEPDDFDRLYARMTRAGKSPRTIQHVHGTARAALNHAVRQGQISRNPAAAAVVPVRKRVPRELPDVERLEQVVALAAQDSLLWAAWFRLAFWTGARPAEVCGLRWADLDLDRAEVTYRTAIGRHLPDAPDSVFDGVTSSWAPKGTKTQTDRHTGIRTVALDLGTVAALRRWRIEVAARLLELGLLLDGGLFVFPSDPFGERPLTPATPSRRCDRGMPRSHPGGARRLSGGRRPGGEGRRRQDQGRRHRGRRSAHGAPGSGRRRSDRPHSLRAPRPRVRDRSSSGAPRRRLIHSGWTIRVIASRSAGASHHRLAARAEAQDLRHVGLAEVQFQADLPPGGT